MMSVHPLIVKNLANIVSMLGVLSVSVLYVDGGYRFVIPIIVFNNIMDDLDGILAVRLKISSAFGAGLDNVCDAVAHVALLLAVGMHQSWPWALLSLVAAVALLVRVVRRVAPDKPIGSLGSPTNELMRHILFALLLASQFEFAPGALLGLIFVAHAVSLVLPYRMPGLLRSLTKSIVAVALLNVSLIVAWLVPAATPFVAAAFGLTYVYGFLAAGIQWKQEAGAQD
jgi:phosphatidylglycerophosphate synthase